MKLTAALDRYTCLWLVALAPLLGPSVASSQGLAEVAKKEEARRKVVKPAEKVYTNDTLRGDITKTPPATPAETPSTPPEPAQQAPQPVPSSRVPVVNLPGGQTSPPSTDKDRAYWSARIGAARAMLERSRVLAEALQSRLNALNTDFVNRDDPAQRAQIDLERQRAVAELDRMKREVVDQTKAIADIEEEARKAGVPPGWLR